MNDVARLQDHKPLAAATSTDRAGAMVPMLERVLMDPSVPVERLERLLAIHDAERQRQAKVAFAEAMSAAQAQMHAVVTDKKNTQTKSRYASYAALDAKVRPIYTASGFSVTFNTEAGSSEDLLRIVAYVEAHGFERRYEVEMPCDGKGARGGDVMTKTHAVKSAVSYGKATLLPMIFNLAVTDGSDDDGNGAGRSDVVLISAEQVAQLRHEMAERGIDESKFIDFAELERLEDMGAQHFATALSKVRLKKKLEARHGA